MIREKTVSGIILIAGNSSRFNSSINKGSQSSGDSSKLVTEVYQGENSHNKNFEVINNLPIFMYSLNVFNNNSYIDDILLVIKESEKEIIEKILSNFKRKQKS